MGVDVIGIGEALWDLLPSGPQLGGAPANFACHARALGAHARLISRVGKDRLGEDIRRRLEALKIDGSILQLDDEAPTGTVTVSLSGNGVPAYVIHENVAWDRLAATAAALEAVRRADAVCFGSLAQRSEPSRTSIQRLVASAPAESLRVFDVNLRQRYFSLELIEQSLHLANVLKLNDEELSVLGDLLKLRGSPQNQLEQLERRYSLRVIALTRGAGGSLLFRNGEWSDCPSVPARVVDTVGAGDAFTATLVMGLLHKMGLAEINRLANEVARYVCSCAGATPPLPERFLRRFAEVPRSATTSAV